MAKPSSHLFLLVVFVFFVSIELASAYGLINSTCKAFARNNPNIDFAFCVTSLQAAPASGCAAAKGIGTIAIRLIRYNVTDTRCFIRQLLREGKSKDPYFRQCLEVCLELYSDAIDTAKQAMKSYSARRFDEANVEISSIMDAATTCEDGFKEGGAASPLTKRNAAVFQLSAVGLSVLRINQNGSLG